MLTDMSSGRRPIEDCIADVTEYKGNVLWVAKRAKLALQVASNDLAKSRLTELASVTHQQTFLKVDFKNITEALHNKIDLGTSTEDLCAAIVKVTAYLEKVAKLLFLLQECRQTEFHAEEAVELVKGHLTEKRTIKEMEAMNEKMITGLQGSAADDRSEEETQLGDSAATGDNLATTDDELQKAMDQGLKLDIDAARHVFAWAVEAVHIIDVCMQKHTISLRPLFETMFLQGMDNRDDRGWMHDLRENLNNIVDMNTRVQTVMDKASTMKKACGIHGQASQSDERGDSFGEASQRLDGV